MRSRSGPSISWKIPGAGEMPERVRGHDWAKTPLGPIDTWSASLKATVALLLNSQHPMFLWWGPDLIQIYNDAYVPSFGAGKHPAALGQRGMDCWPEIWPIIGPQIHAVMSDGTPTWHEDALVPIFRNGAIEEVYWTYGYSPVFDDDGTIGGTLVVCTETTARVLAQKRERSDRERAVEERARLQLFFSQVPAGVCILRGDDLVFDFANENYSRFVGREQLEGRSLLSAMPELQGQGFDTLLRGVMRTGEPFVGHEVLARVDRTGTGTLQDYYYSFSYTPFRASSGAIEGVIAIVFDVTDHVRRRRVAEELRDALEREREGLLERERAARLTAEIASRAKDDFLTTASHELRTPLNAILGWAKMLRLGKLDQSGYQRALESIERNGKAQVRLIEDILDGSRIITGNLHLEIRPLDMTVLVLAAVDSMRVAADAKRIQLTVEVEPAAARITGDPDRLQQIVWNLVNNAIKFTPKGGSVAVTLRREGSDVELAVKDSGQGITAEFLPHVFERFRQAEGSTTRRYGGLGLGLALVRHLAEAHGGTVRAESAGEGLGSKFTVSLPVQAVYEEPVSSERTSPSTPLEAFAPGARLSGISILVVDDEADARDLVATVLSASGATVVAAPSVDAALECVATGSFDVVVSDVGMPLKDGFELMRQLRALSDTRGDTIRGIALTAYAREEDRRLAAAAGFDAHIAKPVDPNHLVRIVASLARPT